MLWSQLRFGFNGLCLENTLPSQGVTPNLKLSLEQEK